MKKMLTLVASLALFTAGAVQAQETLSVQATGATGAPGDTVFVSLTYDYGLGIEVFVEDLAFTYDSPALSFLFADSTVVRDGVQQSLADSLAVASLIAAAGKGFSSISLTPNNLPAGKGGFNFAFTQPDLFGFPGDVRTGLVTFNAAFEIAAGAAQGDYRVSFADSSVTEIDAANAFQDTAYRYPAALQNVQITVMAAAVPEPEMALMLLPGLALIGLQVRRRRARQNQSA